MSVVDRCTGGYPHLAITSVNSARRQVGSFWTSGSSLWLVHLSLRACTAAAAISLHAITRKEKAIGILVPRHERQCLAPDMKFLTHSVHLTGFASQRLSDVVHV